MAGITPGETGFTMQVADEVAMQAKELQRLRRLKEIWGDDFARIVSSEVELEKLVTAFEVRWPGKNEDTSQIENEGEQ